MTVQIFLTLLAVFATATSFITEAVKKTLDNTAVKYASNIVVLIVAVLVGGSGTTIYYLVAGVEWSAINCICIGLMALANWLGAMLGYDKIKQAITQINKGADNNGSKDK